MQKASVFNPQTCIKWLYSHKLKDIIPLRSKTSISKPHISFTLSWYMHDERLRSGCCWQRRLNKSQQSTRVRLGHYQVTGGQERSSRSPWWTETRHIRTSASRLHSCCPCSPCWCYAPLRLSVFPLADSKQAEMSHRPGPRLSSLQG